MENDPDARLAAICAALNPETKKKLLNFSARRCRWLVRLGLSIDGGSVEEFVADAIADTVTGRRKWSPADCDLLTHLFGVIRSRTTDFFRRHSGILVREDPAGIEGESNGSPAHPARTRSDHRVADAELARKIVEELEALAAKDTEVQFLLLSYEDGCVDRGEIIHALGWTESQYDNARRRLTRMADRLPSELSREAQAFLGGAR